VRDKAGKDNVRIEKPDISHVLSDVSDLIKVGWYLLWRTL
jgi:hypothetical protein